MWDKISTALIEIFKTNSLIQSIYNFESAELEGFPALTVTPSANESDYTTTTENRRSYSFVVRVYNQRLSGKDNERNSETTMRQLVDTVLDSLDKNYRMSNLANQSGYMFLFLEAAPSAWGYAGRENNLRVAEIKIRLNFDVDTTVIS